jgi:hypothetical protein
MIVSEVLWYTIIELVLNITIQHAKAVAFVT